MRAWFRSRYGAGPLHLLSLLACFALTGYAASQAAEVPQATRIAVWMVGAVVAHDLLLWPLYALADRVAVRAGANGGRTGRRTDPRRLPAVPWINYLRVPVVLSAVLLAVSFPLVLRLSPRIYRAQTGLSVAPFLGRWLLVTGTAFGLSAILYAIRVGRAMAGAAAPKRRQ